MSNLNEEAHLVPNGSPRRLEHLQSEVFANLLFDIVLHSLLNCAKTAKAEAVRRELMLCIF
jgi:hypothetical protein